MGRDGQLGRRVLGVLGLEERVDQGGTQLVLVLSTSVSSDGVGQCGSGADCLTAAHRSQGLY